MEVSRILRLFRKWFWLVILAALIGGGVTLALSANRQPTYRAETKVLIGGFIDSSNPNRGEIETGSWLAETYVEIVRTPVVLQGVIDTLGLDLTVSELKEMVKAGKPGNPPILIIQALYESPSMAVDIANEAARQLILHSPTNLTPAQQAQVDLADEQIAGLNEQVQEARAELEAIDQRMATAGESSSQASTLTQQRRALIDQINQATSNIAQFSSLRTEIQSQTNRLEIIEAAVEGEYFRTGPGTIESSAISAITGAILAIVGIVAIDYLDSSIRTSKDAGATLELPVLGTIPELGKGKEPYPQRLITNWSSRSVIAEAYRALQTNLLAATGAGRVYLVTSPGPGEGKSVTSTNLAVTLAQNGLRVLLIDADMVKPHIHEFFSLPNDYGLKNLIAMRPTAVSAADTAKPLAQLDHDTQKTLNLLHMSVQQTPIDNLRVITSGPTDDSSTHLSEYHSLRAWMDVFRQVLDVEVVVFDTPPCLVMSDASIIASVIHADCVLVVQSGRTGRDAAIRARTQFIHIGAKLTGVVLNRVKMVDIDHGYNSGYVKMKEMLVNQQLVSGLNGASSTSPVQAGHD